MAYRAKKTEHAGAKKGRGAYVGPKVDAKREGNKQRREDSKAHKLSWEDTAREMAASGEDWSAWLAEAP